MAPQSFLQPTWLIWWVTTTAWESVLDSYPICNAICYFPDIHQNQLEHFSWGQTPHICDEQSRYGLQQRRDSRTLLCPKFGLSPIQKCAIKEKSKHTRANVLVKVTSNLALKINSIYLFLNISDIHMQLVIYKDKIGNYFANYYGSASEAISFLPKLIVAMLVSVAK